MKQSLALLSLLFAGSSGFVPRTNSRQAFVSLSSSTDDKTEVREYFNTEGFNRWNKIYSESDDVNTVQLDIRTGHGQTIQKIVNWIQADGDIAGKSVCDCGCGVGSLAIPLAQMGKLLFATTFIFMIYFSAYNGLFYCQSRC
jgi:magnesium-protoporphyrin O-methyltransferase